MSDTVSTVLSCGGSRKYKSLGCQTKSGLTGIHSHTSRYGEYHRGVCYVKNKILSSQGGKAVVTCTGRHPEEAMGSA